MSLEICFNWHHGFFKVTIWPARQVMMPFPLTPIWGPGPVFPPAEAAIGGFL